jgi:hypothetical protein
MEVVLLGFACRNCRVAFVRNCEECVRRERSLPGSEWKWIGTGCCECDQFRCKSSQSKKCDQVSLPNCSPESVCYQSVVSQSTRQSKMILPFTSFHTSNVRSFARAFCSCQRCRARAFSTDVKFSCLKYQKENAEI